MENKEEKKTKETKYRKAFRFRIYPNKNQERELYQQLETLRRVYNESLAIWQNYYEREKSGEKVVPRKISKDGKEKRCGILESLYPLFSGKRNNVVAQLKRGDDGPHWLSRISAVAMRDTIKRLETAYRNFYDRMKKHPGKTVSELGFPKFKKYGKVRSIPCENYGSGISLVNQKNIKVSSNTDVGKEQYRLKVFGVGSIKIKMHRDIKGVKRIVTTAVKVDSDGKWHVVFVREIPKPEVKPKEGRPVGVDMGIAHFVTTSDGEHFANKRLLKSNLKKMRVLQRSFSRKVQVAKAAKRKHRDCKNLQKARRKINQLHCKISNQRKEYHHQVSNNLVNRYATICVESLAVKNMLRNHNLAQAIADVGWSGFFNTLKNKAVAAGVSVVEVDPRNTSRTCPRCQHIGPENRATQEKFECVKCGLAGNADVIAANNILRLGTGQNGAGLVPVGANHRGAEDCQRNPVCPDSYCDTQKGGRLRASGQSAAKKQQGKTTRSKSESQQMGLFDFV